MICFIFTEKETLLEAGLQEPHSVSEWKWSQVLQGKKPSQTGSGFSRLVKQKQRREVKGGSGS